MRFLPRLGVWESHSLSWDSSVDCEDEREDGDMGGDAGDAGDAGHGEVVGEDTDEVTGEI